MGFDWVDAEYERAMYELHQKAVMARATKEQRIFLFVEGESEEAAIPILFADVIDVDALGVKIANYNGHGNLGAALRLLKLTLSHDRPIILTYDNDPPSISSVQKCKEQGLITHLVYQLPIPTESVVTYPSGHQGGGFEESFPAVIFLTAAFGGNILPANVTSQRAQFEAMFDSTKPWLPQLRKFTASLGFVEWNTKKTALAEAMASECDKLPPTYNALVSLIEVVRGKYPIVHPYDVEFTE
jgi:hypothetical protein